MGRLGHYEVLQILGRGGFGVVFRAFDEVLQRIVAIKVLSPEMAATSPARKRFLREARAAAQVRQENVVQTHAIEERPLPYLVMEYVPGETVQQRLDRIGPLDPAEVAVIGRQVADALAAAHAAGLIHRDIKPSNIMVESGPRLKVKVTDFGLARAADDASITQSGVVAGTPLYMSPEQARGEKLDHRTDLFSLGSVLYALTTGRPPFRAENTLAVLKRVTEDECRPVPEVIPETPAWLCQIIARLMAKAPDRRFQSAAEVSVALEAGPNAGVTPQPVLSRRRSPAWFAIGAGALLATGTVLLVLWAAGWLGDAKGPGPNPLAGGARITPEKAPADGRRIGGGGFRFDRVGSKTRPQVSRDGKLLAAPCGAGVTLFDVTSGEALRTLDSASGEVRGVGFSPDRKRLAGLSQSPGKVRVWSLDNDAVLFTREVDGSIDFEPVFSPDGKWLVIAENQPTPCLRVLDAFTGAEIRAVPTTTWCSGRFNATGSRFAATFRNPGGISDTHPDQEKVTVWDTSDWHPVGTLTHPRVPDGGSASYVQYSPGGRYLAANGDAGIAVWKADTLEAVKTVETPCYWFDFLDEQTLLAHQTNGFEPVHRFAAYDIPSGEKKRTFAVTGPKDFLYPSLNPGRDHLFVAHYQQLPRLRIFDPLTGRELLPGEKAAAPRNP